ncbi:hypothetical protein CTKZ_35610 [Cellulomonas algicola]|uniref:DUF3152 domain-containing protein n=1 Tax=Cellulomonas algicola TaxID=2071633 RepID=A0A401V502_9CELL|nr:DUF3152 domain-containing protein [Cellulomonas algicola]GCD21999.1 hypothetical protein CTKZ_35610 [Cellulomonas algicola]
MTPPEMPRPDERARRAPGRRWGRPLADGRTVAVASAVALGGLLLGAGTATVTLPGVSASGTLRGALALSVSSVQVGGTGAAVADDAQGRAADTSRSAVREPAPEPVPTFDSLLSADPPVVALPPGLTLVDVQAGLLSAEIPERAAGTFSVVPGSDPGPGTGRVRTIRVEVEDGLAVDGARFAQTVMTTLNDPRGWGADGSVSFARTDGPAELRVTLASPESVDDLCAPLDTNGQVSCGRAGNAVLNLRRWVLATQELAGDKVTYRQYLVNHEVGHLLGHGHEKCPAPGALAPLMQQQSYKAAPCVPNPWPFP